MSALGMARGAASEQSLVNHVDSAEKVFELGVDERGSV